MIKRGFSIESSIALADLFVRKKALMNFTSYDVALIMSICDVDKKDVPKVLDLLQFSADNNLDFNSITGAWRNYFDSVDFEKLKNIVISAFQRGNVKFWVALKKNVVNKKLVLTNCYFDSNAESLYININSFNAIVIPRCDLENKEWAISSFYHECTHYIDQRSFYDSAYSEYSKEIDDMFYAIRDAINSGSMEGLLNNDLIPNSIKKIVSFTSKNTNIGTFKMAFKHIFTSKRMLADDYVNDPMLREKWLQEINNKYVDYSEKDRNLFFKERINYERQKYMMFVGCFEDVLDGVLEGFPSDFAEARIEGHGKEYYRNQYYRTDLIEFIAEMGTIYAADGLDVLRYELGDKLTNKLALMFENFLQISTGEMVSDADYSQKLPKKNNLGIFVALREYSGKTK